MRNRMKGLARVNAYVHTLVMPNVTTLECPHCEGGKVGIGATASDEPIALIDCEECGGTAECQCEAGPRGARCQDAAVGEHHSEGRAHDRYAFCAEHLRQARAVDDADCPPDRDDGPSVHDTIPVPAPEGCVAS